MPIYRVPMKTTLYCAPTVEANDEDEARELVFNSPRMPNEICAICSGHGQPWPGIDQDEWAVREEDPITLATEDQVRAHRRWSE